MSALWPITGLIASRVRSRMAGRTPPRNRHARARAAGIAAALTLSLWQGSVHVRKIRGTIASRAESELSVLQQSEHRKVYPYSVIAGGVYTADELERARRTDVVVRKHYAQFGHTPTFKRATQNMLVYVSYRKGDQVYWTKARHRVPQNEIVLTDQDRLARARCGNQLSLTPQGPVEEGASPDEDVLSQAELPQLPFVAGLGTPELPLAELDVPAPAAAPTGSVGQGLAPTASPGAGGPGLVGGIPFLAGSAPRLFPAAPASNSGSSFGGIPQSGASSVIPGNTGTPTGSNPAAVATPEPAITKTMWLVLTAVLSLLMIRKRANQS